MPQEPHLPKHIQTDPGLCINTILEMQESMESQLFVNFEAMHQTQEVAGNF